MKNSMRLVMVLLAALTLTLYGQHRGPANLVRHGASLPGGVDSYFLVVFRHQLRQRYDYGSSSRYHPGKPWLLRTLVFVGVV